MAVRPDTQFAASAANGPGGNGRAATLSPAGADLLAVDCEPRFATVTEAACWFVCAARAHPDCLDPTDWDEVCRLAKQLACAAWRTAAWEVCDRQQELIIHGFLDCLRQSSADPDDFDEFDYDPTEEEELASWDPLLIDTLIHLVEDGSPVTVDHVGATIRRLRRNVLVDPGWRREYPKFTRAIFLSALQRRVSTLPAPRTVARAARQARPRGRRSRTSRVTRAGPSSDDPDLEPPPQGVAPRGLS
jgi:hypothetical protein